MTKRKMPMLPKDEERRRKFEAAALDLLTNRPPKEPLPVADAHAFIDKHADLLPKAKATVPATGKQRVQMVALSTRVPADLAARLDAVRERVQQTQPGVVLTVQGAIIAALTAYVEREEARAK